MVPLLCLLIFSGEHFAFLFLWGLRGPTPRATFCKRWTKTLIFMGLY